MNDVIKRYEEVRSRIAAACIRSGRKPADVKLVAVSKKQPIELITPLIQYASKAKRTLTLGENYVQEFKKKRGELPQGYECHLIGALQRNKAKDAIKLFSVIESVHSIELAQALHREAKKEGKIQDVFLEVNISDDPGKSGFKPELIEEFFHNTAPALNNLRIKGLMTITKLYENPEEARDDFKRMKELGASIENAGIHLELSMGMSSDFEVAIEEGATVVRVGTAIFGARSE